MRYKQYLDDVCKEIRFKAAHKVLRKELTAHIDDKKQALEANGSGDAEAQAIASMGDAAETGRSLDAVHRPRTEWCVLIGTLLLIITGIVAVQAATTYNSANEANELYWSNFIHNTLSTLIIGLFAMGGMYFVGYTYIFRLRHVLFVLPLILIALYNPDGLKFYSLFNQSSVITLSVLSFLLSILGATQSVKEKGIRGFILLCLLCVVPLVAISLIPANTYTLLLGIVLYSVVITAIQQKYFGEHRRWVFIVTATVLFAAVIYLTVFTPVIWQLTGRFAFGTNINDVSGMNQVSKMLNGAQLVGASPEYMSSTTWNLHASRTSFILTSIIGSYGWLAGIVLMIIFIALLALMFIRSVNIRHPFGKLLAIGISANFLARFIIVVLSNLGLVYGIELNLPFVSHGRIDYIANALLIGIFLSVWRRSTFMSNGIEMQKGLFKQKI